MAFRIQSVGATLIDANNQPITNATVSFQINDAIAYTATHIVPDRIVYVVTDSLGAFTINLWAETDSLIPTSYTVVFPTENDGLPVASHSTTFDLTYLGVGNIDLGTLLPTS